jgi:DNA-binding MarR family transcriptional regulator
LIYYQNMTADVDPLLEAAAEIRLGVTRLARRLRTAGTSEVLSANKTSVLAYLYRNGSSSPGQIAAAEHQQPQSLTRTFAELERDGLVSRSRSVLDGRQSVLELTDPGHRALVDDMAERDTWLASALASLTETEAGLLRIAGALMGRIASSVSEESSWPSSTNTPARPTARS